MKLIDWTQKQKDTWATWVATKPECVQKMCRSHPPDEMYKMKSTGQIVTLYSYSEDGTVTVDIDNEITLQLMVPRRVFGIDIKDLEFLTKSEAE